MGDASSPSEDEAEIENEETATVAHREDHHSATLGNEVASPALLNDRHDVEATENHGMAFPMTDTLLPSTTPPLATINRTQNQQPESTLAIASERWHQLPDDVKELVEYHRRPLCKYSTIRVHDSRLLHENASLNLPFHRSYTPVIALQQDESLLGRNNANLSCLI